VICATVPMALAERLLFGTRRGAYSGADADAEGYVQAADGGTLFLDEIGELDANVQAKLLRVLETREVMQLGAARPRKVDFALCSATHAQLQARVAAGSFREDLYFRVGRPTVGLPPVRERLEEVPWIVETMLQREKNLKAHVSLIDELLERPWPGNLRELLVELGAAAAAANVEGSEIVKAQHLAEGAGSHFTPAPEPRGSDAPPGPAVPIGSVTREAVIEALRASGGNISASARSLGLHRTQLRRLLARFNIDADNP
jgi:transcriptional regulator with PAS, ATPase and Fis domain